MQGNSKRNGFIQKRKTFSWKSAPEHPALQSRKLSINLNCLNAPDSGGARESITNDSRDSKGKRYKQNPEP